MKFTLKFLLIFNIFCVALFSNELSDTSNKIISINSQINIIKEQNGSSDDIQILENEKNNDYGGGFYRRRTDFFGGFCPECRVC